MTLKVLVDKTDIATLPADIQRLIEAYRLAYAIAMQDHMAPYPPATEANRARPGTTHYQRGFGTIYTRKRGGTTKRKTSEMMGRKWDIVELPNAVLLRNTASYSPFVHYDALQADFHKKRGWQTEEDAMQAIDARKLLTEISKKVGI